jgi:hypothetical protein
VNDLPQQTINTPRETTHQRIADALEDIVDKIVDTSSADNIDYNNTQSGLSANKVQGAVDELASEKADKSTTLAGYGITDAYTKAEVYTQSEVNNIVSTLETNIDWKEAVNTYSDIATTYPNPQDGWTVNVKDTDYTYRYNGSEWVAISANAIPEATISVKGLMTPTQVSKLNGIEAGAQVNTVTSVAGKTGAVTLTKNDVGLGNVDNTSDLDKPISTAAQTALNDKVDKVQGKGLSTNDYTDAEKQKNADNASAISDIQEDLSTSLTATGNPITIESSESNLVECVAEVEAVQEGSGDPSPDNIRPIIGQTEVVIENAGKTYAIQLGDTIYGGELDVVTGELRVTHGEVDLGDLNYTYESTTSYTRFKSNAISGIKQMVVRTMPLVCSCFQTIDDGRAIGQVPDSSVYNDQNTEYIYIRDSRYTSTSDFKTAVTGQTLVFPLATPYTIQLTPQQIRLLKDTNHLSCNTGDLSIKYYPDNVLGQLKGDIEKGLNAYYDYQIKALWDKIGELQA